jgi:hypothetical protein
VRAKQRKKESEKDEVCVNVVIHVYFVERFRGFDKGSILIILVYFHMRECVCVCVQYTNIYKKDPLSKTLLPPRKRVCVLQQCVCVCVCVCACLHALRD